MGSSSWDATNWSGLEPPLDEVDNNAQPPSQQQSSQNPPPEFLCPLTHMLMVDPVVTCDGNTYERSAISLWLQSHNTEPLTGEVLRTKELYPCNFARSQIRAYMDRQSRRPHQGLRA